MSPDEAVVLPSAPFVLAASLMTSPFSLVSVHFCLVHSFRHSPALIQTFPLSRLSVGILVPFVKGRKANIHSECGKVNARIQPIYKEKQIGKTAGLPFYSIMTGRLKERRHFLQTCPKFTATHMGSYLDNYYDTTATDASKIHFL